jgi:uncharacterized protein YecE (DUF72 family)
MRSLITSYSGACKSGMQRMPAEDTTLYLGTSGWSHRSWVGKLYPHDMPAADYLATYTQHFSAVEIESTFYGVPLRQTVQAWYRRAPDGFRFCPCVPRLITHDHRLQGTGAIMDEFIAVITELDEKLGPLLLQLPENFRAGEQDRLEAFLSTLPQTQQFAIEFRHGSWLKASTYALLEAYQVAWVVVDAPFLPRVPRVTAPFAYIRWHGRPGVSQRARTATAPAAAIQPWLAILRHLRRQVDVVYGFVRNSFSGYAPNDGTTLLDLLGERREGTRPPLP